MISRKWVLPMLIITLLLAACTPEGDKLKEELQQSLSYHNEVQSYYVQGTATIHPLASEDRGNKSLTDHLLNLLLQEEWQWEGYTAPGSLDFDGSLTAGNQHIPLKQKDNRTYFQLPFFDPGQYYYLETASDQLDLILDTSAAFEIAEQADPASFNLSEQESHRTISITFNDSSDPALTYFTEIFSPLEDFLTLPGSADIDYATISFTFNEEGYLVSVQYEWQAGERTAAITQLYSEWSQSSDLNIEIPEDAVSFTALIEKAEELQAADQLDPYDQFMPLVDLQTEYPEDSEEAAIIHLLNLHLSALIEKDRDTFMDHFRSTGYAGQHEDFFERDRKYQFIGVEDLSYRNVNQQRISIRVLHKFMDPGNEKDQLSGRSEERV